MVGGGHEFPHRFLISMKGLGLNRINSYPGKWKDSGDGSFAIYRYDNRALLILYHSLSLAGFDCDSKGPGLGGGGNRDSDKHTPCRPCFQARTAGPHSFFGFSSS